MDSESMQQYREEHEGEDLAVKRNSDLTCLLSCDVCGGRMVYIRGRHPGMDKRSACPTCMAETIDSFKDRLRDDYGISATECG